MSRARAAARRHLPFLALLALGIAVRVVVMVAYRPALLFPDSFGYLAQAARMRVSQVHPAGYAAFLWPLLQVFSVQVVAAVQHLIGLALAVGGYLFLLRRGVPAWAGALATLPVLLDPLQLVLEHYVLSDLVFEALLVAAALLVLWRPRPGVPALVTAGLLVAAATLTRGAGQPVLLVFLVALGCLRLPWRNLVAFALAAVVPLAGYAAIFHHEHGQYALESVGPRYLYARLAPIVRCDEVSLPSFEQPLCPRAPLSARRGIDWYMWHGEHAAQYHVPPPPGMTQLQMVRDYDLRVLRAEPVAYARSVGRHLLKGFSWSRHARIKGRPAGRWLFGPDYWVLPMLVAHHRVPPGSTAGTSVDPAAARFLTGYRQWLWTPGPLLAVLAVLALAAVLGLGRARRSGHRVAVGLLLATCLVPLVTAAAVNGFSWRYQLPQLPLLPLAGVLGAVAVLGGRRRRARAPGRRAPDSLVP